MRILVNKPFTDTKAYVEIACLRAESKPTTGIVMGSKAKEVDTGDEYLFNETAGSWVKQGAAAEG